MLRAGGGKKIDEFELASHSFHPVGGLPHRAALRLLCTGCKWSSVKDARGGVQRGCRGPTGRARKEKKGLNGGRMTNGEQSQAAWTGASPPPPSPLNLTWLNLPPPARARMGHWRKRG